MILTVFSDPALFNNIFLEGILRMLASEYELHRNVSRAAVNRFFETCREAGNEIHTLQIYQNGEKMLRIAPSPYSCTDKRENYSLSKSFASTGIGFAIEEGLLRTDDRIVDLFPDKLPDTVDDHLAAMRLSHVLSMNTGHAGCVMPHMYHTDDVARAFLAQPVPFRPGTHFAYNTGATCLLSALVQRVSGETLFDYVNRKLFVPLGICGAYWNQCGEGVNEGGVGLHLSSDDIIKFALLCLNGGVWGGQAYHQRGVARGGNPRAFRQQQQRNARLDSWIRIPVLAPMLGKATGATAPAGSYALCCLSGKPLPSSRLW